MTQQQTYQKIRANPKFAALAADRSRFAWTLSSIVLALYYTFMMAVAFKPGLLATPLWPGATLTVGVPFGALIIVGSWLLTGLYVRRANSVYETMTRDIVEEAI